MKHIPISFLDLVPVPEETYPEQALQNAAVIAQAAEKHGFNRYWLAEHHNTGQSHYKKDKSLVN